MTKKHANTVQYYTQAAFLEDVKSVSEQIKKVYPDFGKWVGDHVVAIPRGGLIPATYIAHQLDVRNIYTLEEFLGMIKENILPRVEKYRILLIDDISDTGVALLKAEERLSDYLTSDEYRFEITPVTLMERHSTNYSPSCCARVIKHNKWMIFPWELEGVLFAKLSRINRMVYKLTGGAI
jgi:xanthine phosphoribosyltransferase